MMNPPQNALCGGFLYKRVKDSDIVASMSGHKEGSRAFARYRKIDEDTNRKTISLLE